MELFTLTHIIENSAKKYPDKEAFRCLDVSISYLELDVKTNQLAKYLSDSGVKKGDKIGIYLNRCLETTIAIYGILKAGAVYVPLDFTAPHSRTQSLINNCEIALLITSPKLKSKIKSLVDYDTSLKEIIGQTQDISLKTTSWEDIYNIELTNYNPVTIVEHDLAYIMFTSGSTGVPKGIVHTHNSGLNYAKLSSELYGVTANDRVGNHAPIHFDISTFGYFSATLAGASTVIITDAYTKFPVSLAQLMEKEKLTIWYSVPLALIQILLSGALNKINLNSLRWVLFGGEVFGLKYLKELLEKLPNAFFSNVYGPAEVNQCTFYNFNSLSEIVSQIPIGKVWDNTEFKIIDEDDKEVTEGNKGLLVIKSITMMKGYWKNEALTEASFYQEKISTGVTKAYYRTGDLVKLNEKGELLFLGRKDRQIKLRGYRLEIDEIEKRILQYENVIEVAVVIVNNLREEKEMIATVLIKPHINISTEDLIKYCKAHLPIYAVPTNIFILESFPRTSSGKINRKKIEKILEAIK